MDHDEHSVSPMHICVFSAELEMMSNNCEAAAKWAICVFSPCCVNVHVLAYVSTVQSTDSVPPGFEPISLLEALNGLRSVSPAIPSAPLYEEINFSGGLGGDGRQLSSPEHLSDGSLQKSKVSKSPDR